MSDPIFFDNWNDLLRVLITVPFVYLGIILATRVTGKRSTSQMNNFDWVVTVATGAIAGTTILQKSITVSEGVLAIAFLLFLQWLLTKVVYRNSTVAKVVKARPALLVDRGEYLHDAMQHERITEGEIMAALRNEGLINIDEVQWVILEADATFSVIPKSDKKDFSKTTFGQIDNFSNNNSA